MPDALKSQPALIEAGRPQYGGLILINGVQWNAPIGDSVTVLAPGVTQGVPLLEEFLQRFDVQLGGTEETEENFLEGLRFLGERPIDGVVPVALLQHPHGTRTFSVEQIRSALDAGPALVGFCVSSGRRGKESAEGAVHPWASEVGGVADTLFAEGRRVTMVAESDFHQPNTEGRVEFWPGQFRKTCLYCPERSETGVFAGLRSGASYFVVGNIVENLRIMASAGGQAAIMGEVLAVTDASAVEVTVELTERRRLDSMELIGNPGGEARILAQAGTADLVRENDTVRWTVRLDVVPGDFFLRLRGQGRAKDPPGAPACFYTAPLWVSCR